MEDAFRHGATDSGPDPLLDFSTNVHPLGPCVRVLEFLAQARRDRYPDPDYTLLREELGHFHDMDPGRIVPGSGASELIHRVVGYQEGALLCMAGTFVEYAKAAQAQGRQIYRGRSAEEFLASMPEHGSAFLCHPNNPDGHLQDSAFLAEAARRAHEKGCLLVVDLAYDRLVAPPLAIPAQAIALYAPNKPLDMAGVRAAYLCCPDPAAARGLSDRAPSWVVGSEGVELLRAWCDPEVGSWLSDRWAAVAGLRDRLQEILRRHAWEVRPSQANFLLARPQEASVLPLLTAERIRIRDASNMGFPGWFRLAARPEPELDVLEAVLRKS